VIKHFCDRCGCEYKEYPHTFSVDNKYTINIDIMYWPTMPDDYSNIKNNRDLCKSCFISIVRNGL
jgi:hypothetical protein